MNAGPVTTTSASKTLKDQILVYIKNSGISKTIETLSQKLGIRELTDKADVINCLLYPNLEILIGDDYGNICEFTPQVLLAFLEENVLDGEIRALFAKNSKGSKLIVYAARTSLTDPEEEQPVELLSLPEKEGYSKGRDAGLAGVDHNSIRTPQYSSDKLIIQWGDLSQADRDNLVAQEQVFLQTGQVAPVVLVGSRIFEQATTESDYLGVHVKNLKKINSNSTRPVPLFLLSSKVQFEDVKKQVHFRQYYGLNPDLFKWFVLGAAEGYIPTDREIDIMAAPPELKDEYKKLSATLREQYKNGMYHFKKGDLPFVPGYLDAIFAFILAGRLAQAMEMGIEYLTIFNVDNIDASLENRGYYAHFAQSGADIGFILGEKNLIYTVTHNTGERKAYYVEGGQDILSLHDVVGKGEDIEEVTTKEGSLLNVDAIVVRARSLLRLLGLLDGYNEWDINSVFAAVNKLKKMKFYQRAVLIREKITNQTQLGFQIKRHIVGGKEIAISQMTHSIISLADLPEVKVRYYAMPRRTATVLKKVRVLTGQEEEAEKQSGLASMGITKAVRRVEESDPEQEARIRRYTVKDDIKKTAKTRKIIYGDGVIIEVTGVLGGTKAVVSGSLHGQLLLARDITMAKPKDIRDYVLAKLETKRTQTSSATKEAGREGK